MYRYFWGKLVQQVPTEDEAGHGRDGPGELYDDVDDVLVDIQDLGSRSIDNLVGSVGDLSGAERCYSVLVETGVFSADRAHPVTLSPRDFLPVENSYQEPAFTTAHVLEAVQTIFKKEQWDLYNP